MVEESGRFSVGGFWVSEAGKLLFSGAIFAEIEIQVTSYEFQVASEEIRCKIQRKMHISI